ncbi:MAG: NfeD family protein [Acidobacteriota bacterium]|nr:hypothetical protein [Blastocatellia bacterium]MDW8412560.1 NfeD family protein [Acidobacteriota bacterium]
MTVLIFALFLLLLLILSLRKRRCRVISVFGSRGIAETELSPEGIVLIDGEAFLARSSVELPRGTCVTVVGTDGPLLLVQQEG